MFETVDTTLPHATTHSQKNPSHVHPYYFFQIGVDMIFPTHITLS